MDTFEFMLNLMIEIEDESNLSKIFGLNLKNELLCKNCKNVRGLLKEQFSISISFQPKTTIFIYDNETKKKFEVYFGVFFMYTYTEIFKKISDNFDIVKCHHDNDVLINNLNNSNFENSQEDFKSKLLHKYNERNDLNGQLILILLKNDEQIKDPIEINNATATIPKELRFSLYDALLTHGKAEMMELLCICGEEKNPTKTCF